MSQTVSIAPYASRHPARVAMAMTGLLAIFTYGFCIFDGRPDDAVLCTALAVLAASGAGLITGDRIGLRPGLWANPQRWSIGISNAVYFGVYMYALNAQPGMDDRAIRVWMAAGLIFGLVMMVMAKPTHSTLDAQFTRLGNFRQDGGFGWMHWAHPVFGGVVAVVCLNAIAGSTGGLRAQALYLAVLLAVGAGGPLYYRPRPDAPDTAVWRVLRVLNIGAFLSLIWFWSTVA
ncbi:hypothetical protein [Oceaniglobus ichthyenteri]|uniref:hypothetical protein n=1 Tax=Oceaniglobus ichthyenteri TaxID=2136177 RepID=UPI000D348BC4|nr:hypothetical protein [Oceaniglobus ichthyenteri]